MATLAQLQAAYTSITRMAPSAAQNLILQDLATRSTNGTISDAQAYQYIIGQVSQTTTVAELSYQFFTGKTPTSAGLDYLVSSASNPSDLNDPYYQQFNLENRYINFAANLGVVGEGASAFAATYGALSFADTVRVAYERIIGTTQATAAGINVNAAIADISSRQAAFTQIARDRGIITSTSSTAQIDLATKAALVGYIMAEAVKANVGAYVQAVNNFYLDLAPDNAASYNVDLTTSYAIGSGGTGDPGVPGGVTITYNAATAAGTAVGLNAADTAFRSTAANDTLIATGGNITGATVDLAGGNDVVTGGTITGTTAGAATVVSLGAGADTLGTTTTPVVVVQGTSGGTATTTGAVTIDGGAGVDTANISIGAAITYATAANSPNVLITGFETVNIAATAAASIDARSISGATAINHIGGTFALAVNNVADGQVVGSSSTGTSAFTYGTAGVAAANATVNLSGTGLVGAVTVANVNGTTTLTNSANVSVNGFSTSSNTLTATGTTELNLGAVVLGNGNPAWNGSHTLDVSAASRVALNYTTSAQDVGASTNLTDTVKLGAGADVLGLNFGVAQNSTITLGGGADSVTVATTYTDGVGGAVAGGNATVSATAVTSLATITDFAKGVDHINVELGAGAYVNSVGGANYIGAGSERAAALAAAGYAGVNGTTVFEYGGATYIYQDANGSGTLNTGDVLIKLVGLTGATINTTAGQTNTGDIHFG